MKPTRNVTFWTKLTGNRLPKHHLFLDSESDYDEEPKQDGTIKHRFKLACTKYCEWGNDGWKKEENTTHVSTDSIWSEIDKRAANGRMLYVWSHNVSFDAVIVGIVGMLQNDRIRFTGLETTGWMGETCRTNGRRINYFLPGKPCTVVDCQFTKSGNRFTLVDTTNFWRCSLAKLGEQLGIPKLAMPEKDASENDWRTYCCRDVEIIGESVRRLLSHCGNKIIGPFRPTIGGIGFSTLRKSYLNCKVGVENNRLARRLERAAYCGGQTECYYAGRKAGTIYQLDVCSLYPSIACEYRVPIRCVDMVFRKRSEAVKSDTLDYSCVADVLIETKTNEVPLKTERNTHYFVGRFWTQLCGEELARCQRNNQILKVASVLRYDTRLLFRPMFTSLLTLRKNALDANDEFTASLLKNVCNSLIGKIGAKANNWVTLGYGLTELWCGNEIHVNAETGEAKEYRTIAGWLQENRKADDIPQSFPAIPAFITSAARERMRLLRSIAGKENTFYQATDCLHVNQAGFDALLAARLVRDNESGFLSLKATASAVEYRGPNFYCWDHKWVKLGISGKAVKTHSRHYTDYAWESLASALTRSPDDTFHVEKILKMVRPRRIDGYVRSDKKVARFRFLDDQSKRPHEIAPDFWKGDLVCT